MSNAHITLGREYNFFSRGQKKALGTVGVVLGLSALAFGPAAQDYLDDRRDCVRHLPHSSWRNEATSFNLHAGSDFKVITMERTGPDEITCTAFSGGGHKTTEIEFSVPRN
jgi:hypothetical protein